MSSEKSAAPPNALIREKSPYLLQHAHNPVDWRPWGEEAFAQAKSRDVPIFLSIGYSTCHWCHVMERESFSDPAIAALLNRNFVPVKVDREERPDVDKIYMTAVQAMTGAGGWPLSAWLTPDLQPFFGGTYFPPEPRWGRAGFPQILERIAELWRSDREKLAGSGREIGRFLEKTLAAGEAGALPGPEILDRGLEDLAASYDESRGGFGGAPKFPMPVNINFLLRVFARTGNRRPLDMAVHTLREMARGGIHDHIGGGFHRYSTDAKWHVPHFEKMLYDNAQIAVNFLEASRASGDETLSAPARAVLEYVRRDMTHPDGGFYSAEDADSLPPRPGDDPAGGNEETAEGRQAGNRGSSPSSSGDEKAEGAFYVWTKEEIVRALGAEAGEIFSYRHGVAPTGNAENDPQGEFENKNILFLARTEEETAQKFGKTPQEIRRVLEDARRRLFEIRAGRPRPHLDDKILASWNGLMISAFSRAAQILDEPAHAESAAGAARFLRARLYDAGARRLFRRWRDGERSVPGMADDYAFLIQGLLDLYEAGFDAQWLDWAEELADAMIALFHDPERGGFYMTAPGHDPRLPARAMDDTDNVEPSASSVAALSLLRLARLTDREDFSRAAEKTLALFGLRMESQPRALPQMLAALDFHHSPPLQVVLAGDPADPAARALLREIRGVFAPSMTVLAADGGPAQERLARRLPYLKNLRPEPERPAVHVCRDRACGLPITDPARLREALAAGAKPAAAP
ncbi:MAG: thioredoxin domain-containing protein [Elusimicrobiota bacterium]